MHHIDSSVKPLYFYNLNNYYCTLIIIVLHLTYAVLVLKVTSGDTTTMWIFEMNNNQISTITYKFEKLKATGIPPAVRTFMNENTIAVHIQKKNS